MRALAIIFLFIGVALAGGAVYVAMNMEMLPKTATNVEPEGPRTVNVVAARVPLNYGDRLTYEVGKDVLQFVEWPETAVPEGAFKTADELFGEDKKAARIVTRTIEPGELLLKTKLTGFGESVRVATQVRDGFRAVTIPINAVTGAAGLISPGDHVDVLFTRRNGDTMSSHILLQNVLVVATDQATNTERRRAQVARTATVEVARPDAQKLILAMQAGTLSLLLRGINEGTTDEDPTSLDTSILPGAPEPEPEVKPEPEPEPEKKPTGYSVKVRKAGEESVKEFE